MSTRSMEPQTGEPQQRRESQARHARAAANREAVADRPDENVARAYRVCEEIARREARNFYYAFRALPRAKRNAICAVYAFMRHADDVSDDESLPVEQRRVALDQWLRSWHELDSAWDTANGATGSGTGQEFVFIALADAKRRFGISSELLDELVQGTATDLQQASGKKEGELDLYATFNDLYRYCYLVASVVGLVCIRIFGYQDPHAEKLAEETGIAFQLTNILRDVREDAERARIYLPVEDMARFAVTPGELATVSGGHKPSANQRDLFAFEAARAVQYYKSAELLLPLIAEDSRAALWVLVTIYRRLLQRIVAREFDVFSEKVRVPTWEKLWILTRGLLRVLAYRLGWA